jgi:4'-phosphopantetheinyl transferase
MSIELTLYKIDLQTDLSTDGDKVLSPEEQRFAQTICNQTLKKQHITIRVRLRQILAAYLNQPKDKINIAKTSYGKPYLVDYPEIYFNISHSAKTLVVAISQIGAVGIDIEQAKKQRTDFSGLVAKCFANSEREYWHNLPEGEKTAEFYRFWTRKEAFVKAVGRGLAMGLQECEIVSGKEPYFLRIPKVYGKNSDWRLFDLFLEYDLYGALVIESKKITTDFVLPEIRQIISN